LSVFFYSNSDGESQRLATLIKYVTPHYQGRLSGENMVLEDEEYIDADHKEYRTPRMFFWNAYYSGIRKELDKLLAD